MKKISITSLIVFFNMIIFNIGVYATSLPIPKVGLDIEPANNPQEVSTSLQILFLLTIISLAPSILIMMTAFTRIIIVLHFLRSAIGTQQTPPTQILIGLALFLTFFIMAPTFTKINDTAFKPYSEGKISQDIAIKRAGIPLKEFMIKQVYEKDVVLFAEMAKLKKESIKNKMEIPMHVIIPAFIISELKKGFMIGFLLYIPFIVIDMVVASTLMSMGMMMLPPPQISLPFKLLLFVAVDGWNLVIGQLVNTFR